MQNATANAEAEVRYTRYEVRRIDARQEPDGAWAHNETRPVCDGLVLASDLTDRGVLWALADAHILKPDAVLNGLAELEWLDADMAEVRDTRTGEPLVLLLARPAHA